MIITNEPLLTYMEFFQKLLKYINKIEVYMPTNRFYIRGIKINSSSIDLILKTLDYHAGVITLDSVFLNQLDRIFMNIDGTEDYTIMFNFYSEKDPFKKSIRFYFTPYDFAYSVLRMLKLEKSKN